MKTVKSHEEEEDEEELGSKRDATNSNSNTSRDGKNSDKANAIRSKHSVTEQRRRSKINERFQILRDLIPNTDQKRDTASFLLEVIQYVQFLQEKVQKYEGSYQPWSSEPTKLMPWRNSHWRMQSFVGSPQIVKNGTGPGPTYAGRFDENPVTVPSAMQPIQQNPIESHPSSDSAFNAVDSHNELATKAVTTPMTLQASLPAAVQNEGSYSHTTPRPASDAQSNECPNRIEALSHREESTIEGGTISISSVYSEGLLNSLAQALQSTGVDLSQATISVQINLGKRANRGLNSSLMDTNDKPAPSVCPAVGHFRDTSTDDDLDQAQKRLRI
ncbi:PREDICTED: transcription factor BIM2 isoform X2 [Ipomoea nil]|uniref:transcription factor BIM2 isoform X2 n=1 Tax=Ipomoea nil TaxID=35883 RepID=UPI0009013C99|nr:PREDICTED: transcription factor BIM2 isoform X2 [Ipomoea nil]